MGLKILNNTGGVAIPVRRPLGALLNAYEVGVGGLATSAVISSVVICNNDAALSDTFVLYACKAAESAGANNVIAKGTIPPGESYVLIAGLSLAVGESIQVIDVGSKLTCTVFGSES
jgi:hypothetical protein